MTRCSFCGGSGLAHRWSADDCGQCRGLGFISTELPCCSSCGDDSDDLVEDGETNGGDPWLLCGECSAVSAGIRFARSAFLSAAREATRRAAQYREMARNAGRSRRASEFETAYVALESLAGKIRQMGEEI